MGLAEIDININTLLQTRGIVSQGFGLPLIEGVKFPFFRVKTGVTDPVDLTKEILWISKIRNTIFQQITLTDPAGADSPLSVSVTGAGTSGSPHVIDVSLETDSGSALISTAAEVAAIVNADGTAGVLINGTPVGSGLGVVAAEGPNVLVTVGPRYNEFIDTAEMTALGYLSTDEEFLNAEQLLAQDRRPPVFAVHSRDTDDTTKDTITEALLDLIQTQNRWYFLLIVETDKASLNEAGDFASSNEKLFVGNTPDITAFESRNNIRETYIIDDKAATELPAAAWVGRIAPTTPGSVTWKWKQLNNVTAGLFTTTQLLAIRAGNSQALEESRGRIFTNEGKTTGGEFNDLIRGRDFLNSRLFEELLILFTNAEKVGLDDPGIGEVTTVVRAVLKEVSGNDFVAAVSSEADQKNSDDGKFQYQVSAPTFAEIPLTDKTNRNLPDIKFTLVPKGAIHTLTINGTIGFGAVA